MKLKIISTIIEFIVILFNLTTLAYITDGQRVCKVRNGTKGRLDILLRYSKEENNNG